jgi:hypothetical protein
MFLSCGLFILGVSRAALLSYDGRAAFANSGELSRDVSDISHKLFGLLDRQILVSVSLSCLFSSFLQTPRKVRSHHRDVVSKSSYRLEEFSK